MRILNFNPLDLSTQYGRQLQENYRSLSEELAQEELDRLANARSCSVASIQGAMTSSLSAGSGHFKCQSGLELPAHHVPSSGASSSSSSGCLSDGALSSSTEQDHDIRSSGVSNSLALDTRKKMFCTRWLR